MSEKKKVREIKTDFGYCNDWRNYDFGSVGSLYSIADAKTIPEVRIKKNIDK